MALQDAQTSRRLPVFILADRSGSMAGEKIVQVNSGLQLLKSDLETEPRAVQTVWISVISFGDGGARVDVALTELMGFIPPSFTASGGTPMGEALRLLNQEIDNNVRMGSDYKPLVFLFTDGEPTDEWRSAAAAVKQRSQMKTANIIAIGCGSDVNLNTLKEISETVLHMSNVSSGQLQNLMAWISQSVKKVSQTRAPAPAAGADPNATQVTTVQPPALPPGITWVV